MGASGLLKSIHLGSKNLTVRIVLWYVGLMSVSALVSIGTIYQVMLVRMEERVNRTLVQEVEKFRRLVREPGRDSLQATFDDFLSRNIPYDGIFLLTFLEGELYLSSPTALPEGVRSHPQLLQEWGKLRQQTQGKRITPTDTLLYLGEPVQLSDGLGVFVVVQSTARELQEVRDAVGVVVPVTLVVLTITSVSTWMVARKVLAPLRLLAQTAHSIGESNFSQRIPVQGVDEIAELTRTFNEMLDRLEATLTSQREFIADAGHELRTPLTIIQGHLELMGNDPREQEETLALVRDELERMGRLVNDLILLAKAERPDFLDLETLDTDVFTEELYAKAVALGNRVWLLEVESSAQFVADRGRLTQAVMNLAQNAVTHTEPGGTIAIGCAATPQDVRFWVRDNGVGISPADQERIFQRFARARVGNSNDGTGLGLAIVRAIVLAHGGSVELTSSPGQGATFTLIVPHRGG